ncbi:MAG: hypothetical protein ACE5DK_04030 [Paracoccaceae bacterium]
MNARGREPDRFSVGLNLRGNPVIRFHPGIQKYRTRDAGNP